MLPNTWGLSDTHGNVREWVENQSTKADTGAPERVHRGGNWANPASSCAVGNRPRYDPAYRSQAIGLRVARVP